MATTHVQGVVGSIVSGTSGSIALTNPPALGNLVCVGFISTGTTTGYTVKDANGNLYTNSSGSPLAGGSLGAFDIWMSYWHAASVPSKTLNFSWTGSAAAVAWIDEFSHSGNCKFDKDASANSGVGTAANTPTITPTFAGSLLYSTAAFANTCTAPVAGGTQGAWTGAGGAITNGDMSEYILSQAATSRAVDYVQDISGRWMAMVMAFMLDQSGHIQLEGGTGNVELENLTGDIALET